MENSLQNVSIFQFIFVDQEIDPFIQEVTQFAHSIQTKLTSLEKDRKLNLDSLELSSPLIKKNFLFTHCFKFDIDHLDIFSSQLRTLFIQDFHHFKKVILEISYRIIKGVLRKKLRFCSAQLGNAIEKIIDNIIDPCQIRISIEPFNLPFENSGFRKLDGTISVGHHIFLTGRVTNVEQPKCIIIRRLYRCKNPNCKNTFYLHFNDISSNSSDSSFLETNFSSVYCDKCNELASEDETGRIMASFQKFFIVPSLLTADSSILNGNSNLFFSDSIINYKYFSFFPQIELKVKDFDRDNNYKCSESLMVGKLVDVIGTSIKRNARIICEPNFSFSQNPVPRNEINNTPKAFFSDFLARIESFFPGATNHKPLLRIATAALCAISSSTQLLFVVKTSEDMKMLIRFLVDSVLEPNDCDIYLPNEKSLIKNNLKDFAKNQLKNEQQNINHASQPQPPGLLSRKSIIIYHLESINNRNRDKLKRIITQKSVSGCKLVSMTLIGILVSEELSSDQISLFDSFPMVMRVESFPRKLFINLFIDRIGCSNSINLLNKNENPLASDNSSDSFIRLPNEEKLILQIRQDFKNITISEECQILIDNFIAYIDRNSNLSENQIEHAMNEYGSNNASMIKFANSGLNLSPEIIAMNARSIAAIRGDSIATENDAVVSIYFYEERLTALSGSEDNELDQFPPGSGAFFCAGISAIPTKDEGVLFGCYCSILNRIISC